MWTALSHWQGAVSGLPNTHYFPHMKGDRSNWNLHLLYKTSNRRCYKSYLPLLPPQAKHPHNSLSVILTRHSHRARDCLWSASNPLFLGPKNQMNTTLCQHSITLQKLTLVWHRGVSHRVPPCPDHKQRQRAGCLFAECHCSKTDRKCPLRRAQSYGDSTLPPSC